MVSSPSEQVTVVVVRRSAVVGLAVVVDVCGDAVVTDIVGSVLAVVLIPLCVQPPSAISTQICEEEYDD